MEKKLIALVFIALLVGLGGGYGLGYAIYYPQIQNLQEALDNLNDKVETINSTLTSLQNELTTLSSEVANLDSTVEKMENKTWHFLTNFTLHFEDEPISPLFFIQGERWRIKWEPQQIWIWDGFIIWDENGYTIDYIDYYRLMVKYHEAKGIYYVVHGKGSYYIECLYGPNVNFTIESYH